jgi:CheY-like chemotaxis protein
MLDADRQVVDERVQLAAGVARQIRSGNATAGLYDTQRLACLVASLGLDDLDDGSGCGHTGQYTSETDATGRGRDCDMADYVSEHGSGIPDKDPSCLGRILLVEDEMEVREMAMAALEMQGYQVTAVTNGREARDFYRENWPRVDLVLTDIVMPELDGGELLAEIQKVNPAARVLLMSGYTSEATAAELLRRGARSFLSKPYSLEDLWSAVEQALHSPEPTV